MGNTWVLFSRSLSLCLSLYWLYSIDYSQRFHLLLDDTLDPMTVQRLVARKKHAQIMILFLSPMSWLKVSVIVVVIFREMCCLATNSRSNGGDGGRERKPWRR